MLWQWLDAVKLENEKWVEMTDFSWMLLVFFSFKCPSESFCLATKDVGAKKNLKQLNIYETKFKSLRKNFTFDTSLFYWISLWNPQPLDDAIHTNRKFLRIFLSFWTSHEIFLIHVILMITFYGVVVYTFDMSNLAIPIVIACSISFHFVKVYSITSL